MRWRRGPEAAAGLLLLLLDSCLPAAVLCGPPAQLTLAPTATPTPPVPLPALLSTGAKLFYLSGMRNGKYLRREVHNLARFISVMKFRPLAWRAAHPFLVADRCGPLRLGGCGLGLLGRRMGRRMGSRAGSADCSPQPPTLNHQPSTPP